MNRYAVVGAGLMGKVIAKDLIESENNSEVTIFDNDDSALQNTKNFVTSSRLKTEKIDINDINASSGRLKNFSIILSALPHSASLNAIKTAIEAGISCVDLVGSMPEKRLELNKEAEDAGILVVPGCGVAPGISNICVARGIELLDETDNAFIYVGGIPRKKEPPLYYQTVYLLESVFNAYSRDAKIIENGVIITVPPLSGLENITFEQPIGDLEAFYTDGLGSLVVTVKNKIKNKLFEKTLRYPGHVDAIKILKQCGLLDTDPVNVGNIKISPRDIVIKKLENKLTLGPEGDILVMRIIVEGKKNNEGCRHVYDVIDYFDPHTGYTAMARTTGFPAVITAQMIINGEISEKGVKFPEQIFIGYRFDKFIKRLSDKRIKITYDKKSI